MKKFLSYIIVFCLPIIATTIMVEFILRQMPNPYKYKFEWMQENSDDVETIILGSSHTFYGISPKYMECKAFNLANVSQSLSYDMFLLKYWSKRYKHLKTVVCPISFSSLFSRGLENGSESYRCRYYKIYMDCDMHSDFSLYNFEVSDVRTANGKLNKFLKGDDNPGCDEYGWGNAYLLSGKDSVNWNNGTEANAAVKRHTEKNWDYLDGNYNLLKAIAMFCKERNIQLILITTPCWHVYYDNLDEKQWAKTYELIDKLQEEFDVPYYDFLKDERFDANDFYDSNHLSDVGAEKFSKILSEIIKDK